MTRILACADLQIGAGAGYLDPKYGSGSRLHDHEGAWRDCVEHAARHDAKAIIVAGDVFEEKRPGPSALLAFQRGLDIARTLGIHVVILAGNHDVRAADEPAAIEVFAEPDDTVRVHRTPGWHWLDDDTGYAVLPWTTIGGLAALREGGDRDLLHAEAGELLVQVAAGLRAELADAKHRILIAHWAVSGASLPSGVLADELSEVVLPAHLLVEQGWDAVILGHLHRFQMLSTEPPVFFCGSPLPCDFGEAGYPHGAVLLELDETPGAGATFLPIESRPFVTVDVDDVWDGRAAIPAEAIVRVTGRLREDGWQNMVNDGAGPDWIDRTLKHLGAASVRIDVEIVRESRARVETLTTELGPVQALDAWIDSQDTTADPDTLRRVHLSYLEQEHAALRDTPDLNRCSPTSPSPPPLTSPHRQANPGPPAPPHHRPTRTD